MQLTKKQRQIGLSFAAELQAMALRAPDVGSKRELYKTINNLRKKFGLSKDEKKLEIFRLVKLGASTAKDLASESGLVGPEIQQCLNELVEEKRIFMMRISATGDGRPTHCYFPIEAEK